jgi:hypothetical protein
MNRRKSCSLFDAKVLSILFDYAFKHLSSSNDEPFDFSQCRQQVSLPETTEGHFAEFLGRCIHNRVEGNFEAAASVVASCIVRRALKSDGPGEIPLFTIAFRCPLAFRILLAERLMNALFSGRRSIELFKLRPTH